MDLPKQKDFYDSKRQFQGRDQPQDVGPTPEVKEPMPRGQMIFGVIFLGVIILLAVMRIKSAREELVPTGGDAKPAAAAPAAPAKK
jgi:hypothetical protein